MTFVRAQISLPFFTGIPEDVSTNTLYFERPDAVITTTTITALVTKLTAAYAEWGVYYSNVVDGPATVKFYDMADPLPRSELFDGWGFSLPAHNNQGLPEEVAICLSFKAAGASGQPAGRRRGRIYIGPLGSIATEVGTTTSFCNIPLTVRGTILDGADVLNDDTDGWEWRIYSPTDNAFRPIVQAWVDDSPDTQRRRGHPPTTRSQRFY